MSNQEIKELHNLIGNAYCLYELSESAFNYWLELIKPKGKATHTRCGEVISYQEVTKGYEAQCPACDEDLYSFEIVEIR